MNAMPPEHASFVGSIPDIYDRCLGPLFIVPYARELASRISLDAGGQLLELACGTGLLTREIVSVVPPTTTIEATDLNDAMLAIAAARLTAPNVRWRMADAMALPFDGGVFDAAVCGFGVMFFPDRIEAARQVRRTLKPGASYWFTVWASRAENPVARIAHETTATFFDGDAPAFSEIPFGYHDKNQIAADLRHAGFTSIDIDTVDKHTDGLSAADAAVGLVQGNPGVLAIRERARATLDEVTAAVADAIRREFGDGAVRAPMRAHIVHAR